MTGDWQRSGDFPAPSTSATASRDGRIPLCVPSLGDLEWRYLQDALESTFVSTVGPFVSRLESELAESVGVRYAVATMNGTAALHLALLVAGVRPGDEVIVPSLTFIAPANAIRYVGAHPVFVDVDEASWQLDPDCLDELIRERYIEKDGALRSKSTGRILRAVLPVDILGHPVHMDRIRGIIDGYSIDGSSLRVIEDASESLGGAYRGRPVGSLGDAGCLSFNGNKIITSGGGGMLLTDEETWAERARYLSTQAKDDAVRYVHETVGYNYRMTNLQAALGCAQLQRLRDHVDCKRRLAKRYEAAFRGLDGVSLAPEAEWAQSTFWLYTVRFDRELTRHTEPLEFFDRHGVETRPVWQPLHRSPAHASAESYECPVADSIHETALSLPCSVELSEADQDHVVDVVRAYVRRAG